MTEAPAVYHTNGHVKPKGMTLLEAAEAQHEIIYALVRLLAEAGVKVGNEFPAILAEIVRAKAAIDAAQKEAE